MKKLALDLNDEAIFQSAFQVDSYSFLAKHIDAFLHMCHDQEETFWLRYLISFRDYIYNKGFVSRLIESNSVPLCSHRFAFTGDDIFITIHREFIVNSTPGKLKCFISDLLCLGCNQELLVTCNDKSIVNNPFFTPETRDSFRRLFGLNHHLPPGIKKLYLVGIGLPAYMMFGGGLCVFLRKWLKTKENCEINQDINNIWTLPNDWRKSSFLPNRFEKYLAKFYKNDLALKLNINGRTPMEKYNKIVQEIEYGDIDENFKVLDCSCNPSQKKFIVFNPDLSSSDDVLEELLIDSKLMDQFEIYLKQKNLMPRVYGATKSQVKEELRRKMLFELAEEQFEEEYKSIPEKQKNEIISKKKAKKKTKKKKNCETPKPTLKNSGEKTEQTNPSDFNVSELDEDLSACMASMKTIKKSTNKIPSLEFLVSAETTDDNKEHNIATNYKSRGNNREDNLSQIHNNLNQIERCIHETGGLDIEHLSLMFQIGNLFKDNPKPSEQAPNSSRTSTEIKNKIKKKCAGCSNIEEKGVKLKKCARCKMENIAEPRFYCSRECQVDDWKECHQSEHEKGNLVKI